MNAFLILVHMLAFGAGFAVSFGNNMAFTLSQRLPAEQVPALRAFAKIMSRVGDVALVLLWISGVALVFTKYGGIGGVAALPAFWAKLACVILLTALVGMIHMTVAKVNRGDAAVASRLPTYGRFGFLLLLLIVIFAVIAFG